MLLLTQLPQELFYQKRLRLSDFIETSDVYDLLYTTFIRVKDKPYTFKFETLDVFNNAAALCTMVLHDNDQPAEHYNDCWDSIYRMSTTRYRAQLTMWFGYGLLSLLQPSQSKIDRFLNSIDNPCNQDAVGKMYKEAVLEFIQDAKERNLQITAYDFPLQILSTKENLTLWNRIDWKKTTHDFQTECIDQILEYWDDYTDKQHILDWIRRAFLDEEEQKRKEQEENPFNLPF